MYTTTIVIWGVVGLAAAILLVALGGAFFTIRQQKVGIIERFGRFVAVAHPGLNTKLPLIDKKVGELSLRIRELDVEVETKTADDVFVKLLMSVQYFVMPDKVEDAFYRLTDPHRQIESYVFDEVRAQVPTMILDDVFQKKDDIADSLKGNLTETMGQYGYGIVKALVNDIDPDAKVKAAMNEVNAAARLRKAAQEKAEAEKILVVKAAEAEAESKKLQGMGIAQQRSAIIDGLRGSVEDFKDAVEGATAQDVMNLVLMTQYFDTMKDIGAQASSNTILIPHSPGALGDLSEQMRNAMITARKAA